MKKILTLVLIAMLVLTSLGAASAEELRGEGKTIGICLTSQALARTVLDSVYLTEYLGEMGYEVEIVFSEQDAAVQSMQLETFVSMGVDGIIISPSDGTALTNAVELAYDNDVPVMDYDALIMDSPYVEYYATDDLYAVGATQGKFLVDALGLAEGKGPFNLEIFSGSMTDNNANYFYQAPWTSSSPTSTAACWWSSPARSTAPRLPSTSGAPPRPRPVRTPSSPPTTLTAPTWTPS